jgi:uncharacterized membrane protein YfcA
MPTAIAAIAVAIGGVVQVATGFGFSLVSAPFLVAVYGAHRGVQLNLVLSPALNLAILAREYRQVDVPRAAWMLVPAALVVIVAAPFVRHADTAPLTAAAGVLIVAGVIAMARGARAARATGRAGAGLAGAVSGAMTVVSGAGGPPVVLYMVNAEWPPARTRPTLQAFFLGLNVVALVSLHPPAHVPLVLPAALVLGLLIGALVARRVPTEAVRRGTLVLAAAGGLAAIARGILG